MLKTFDLCWRDERSEDVQRVRIYDGKQWEAAWKLMVASPFYSRLDRFSFKANSIVKAAPNEF